MCNADARANPLRWCENASAPMTSSVATVATEDTEPVSMRVLRFGAAVR
jgi:hypothetical protein